MLAEAARLANNGSIQRQDRIGQRNQAVICKNCQREYGEFDQAEWSQPPYEGWHPMYGECYLCFCYAMFGGMMERHPSKEISDRQIYEITPPGVPSIPWFVKEGIEPAPWPDNLADCDFIPF
jgi:hypothetical protein